MSSNICLSQISLALILRNPTPVMRKISTAEYIICCVSVVCYKVVVAYVRFPPAFKIGVRVFITSKTPLHPGVFGELLCY